ncbi:hypothetical protein BD626DRAFT_256520 [Schizophyllum amplum]|uniref:Uncharacterized protein n=1 Tax=Schizophyllum amplum TaxID=97359 RepID=A0A550BUX4_9AGAR|nr:hypothetical protein BD626DRAFT_256520 [Auriculariopsis ampla]
MSEPDTEPASSPPRDRRRRGTGKAKSAKYVLDSDDVGLPLDEALAREPALRILDSDDPLDAVHLDAERPDDPDQTLTVSDEESDDQVKVVEPVKPPAKKESKSDTGKNPPGVKKGTRKKAAEPAPAPEITYTVRLCDHSQVKITSTSRKNLQTHAITLPSSKSFAVFQDEIVTIAIQLEPRAPRELRWIRGPLPHPPSPS